MIVASPPHTPRGTARPPALTPTERALCVLTRNPGRWHLLGEFPTTSEAQRVPPLYYSLRRRGATLMMESRADDVGESVVRLYAMWSHGVVGLGD